MTTVTVFGGTGFLGRRLVQRLAAEGASVRVAVRHPDPARSGLRAAGLDQITVLGADVRDQASAARRRGSRRGQCSLSLSRRVA